MRPWLSRQLQALKADFEYTPEQPSMIHGWVALILAPILLTLYYYYGRSHFYNHKLASLVEPALGIASHPYKELFPFVYWALISVTIRLLIPALAIRFVLKEKLADYGFRLWKKGHAKIYLGMYGIMLPLLFWASSQPDFMKKYPFYKGADQSLVHFIVYELAYGTQFAALEGFFRGFLLFALYKRFGHQAILIMTLPYCMIHFGKPIPETLGSIIAGIVLGHMALKSKSWIPGALLHWSIGFTMDILCLWQRGA